MEGPGSQARHRTSKRKLPSSEQCHGPLVEDRMAAPPQRKKRGRHPAACASCHRRKQRCDGALPCFNCTRRHVGPSCTYTTDAPKIATTTLSPPSTTPTDTSAATHRLAVETLLSAASANDGGDFDQAVILNQGQRSSAASDAQELNAHWQAQTPRSPRAEAADQAGERLAVGDLYSNRDARAFFGSSYFGPQVAAKIMSAPAVDFASGLPAANSSTKRDDIDRPSSGGGGGYSSGIPHSFRNEGGPFSQIWDLLGILPWRKSMVDRLTGCFLSELNWAIDAVHPADFAEKYEAFWARKFGGDDFSTVDLRWLSLLLIVLAFGVLLDCPRPRNRDAQRGVQESSMRFYWAARRAIVIAPTFYGESVDLVRAGVLVTRYLIWARRVPESWLTTSFAMRMAQAQGMHIDGSRWRLSRQKTETRRRLWSHLYCLDKTIALAIGRPFAIVDSQCLVHPASNVFLDDMTESEAEGAPEQPLSQPTPSLGSRLAHELAIIVGRIQERCFGLSAPGYDAVLQLDGELVEWERRLPPYFRLAGAAPDAELDARLPWLPWTRLRLHAEFHFARVTLHRPFLLRHSITERFRASREACMSSACADLGMRLQYLSQGLTDRMKWTLGPHHLFNSALVLGIMAVRDPHSRRSRAVLEDLAAYCEMQRNDTWINEFALAEVKIVELCIRKARGMEKGSGAQPPPQDAPTSQSSPAPLGTWQQYQQHHMQPPPARTPSCVAGRQMLACPAAEASKPSQLLPPENTAPSIVPEGFALDMNKVIPPSPAALGLGPPSVGGGHMLWDEQPFSLIFPEAGDLTQWEQVLNSIMQGQGAM